MTRVPVSLRIPGQLLSTCCRTALLNSGVNLTSSAPILPGSKVEFSDYTAAKVICRA